MYQQIVAGSWLLACESEVDMKLRVGLIGCGSMGRHHAVRLVRQENIALAGVADVNPEAAAASGVEFGACIFDACDALLASRDIDASCVEYRLIGEEKATQLELDPSSFEDGFSWEQQL
jgi:predicted homoserine dehydrogenase-like protein